MFVQPSYSFSDAEVVATTKTELLISEKTKNPGSVSLCDVSASLLCHFNWLSK